jgi:hypothetical protein
VGVLYTYDTVDDVDVDFGFFTLNVFAYSMIGFALTEDASGGGVVVGSGLVAGLKLERRRLVA